MYRYMKRFLGLFAVIALSFTACSADKGSGYDLPAPSVPSDENQDGNDLFVKEEGVIRLVTYNVYAFRNSTMCGVVADMMTEMKADVISFNEVDNKTRRSGYVDQLATFVSNMPDGWKSVFARAIDREGGEYGNGIAYNPEAVGEIVSQYTLSFPNSYEDRVCLVIEFEKLVFASTHLDVSSSDERLKEATEITESLKKNFAGKDKPVFLAGDMNEYPHDAAVMKLRDDWEMISVNSPTYPSDAPAKCIDMIFHMDSSAECEVTGSRVGQRFNSGDAEASDHLPIYADIILSK